MKITKDHNSNKDKDEQSTDAASARRSVEHSPLLEYVPLASSDLEVAETVSIAGLRPISVSTLQVVETYNSMGIRPIGANTFEVVDSINISGIRPIGSSSLVISESYSCIG